MKRFSLICAASIVFAASLCAQRIPDADIPTPPATGLSDEGGVLGTSPGVERQIIGQIQDLVKMHGFRLYLVIESSLISSNPSDFAARLQQEWLPDGAGLVIVFEADTNHLGFGRSLDPSDGFVENGSGVPAYELVAIISKAVEGTQATETTEVYLDKLMSGVCAGLQGYFGRKNTPVDGSRSLKLALVTVGALSLLALCGMGLGWIMGKADRQRSAKRIFPAVEVPERLSAPYGGGGGGYGRFGGGGP